MRKLLLTLLTTLLVVPLGKAATEDFFISVGTTTGWSSYGPTGGEWTLWQSSAGTTEVTYPRQDATVKHFIYKHSNGDYIKISFSETIRTTHSSSTYFGLNFRTANTKITIETSSPQLKVNSISLSGVSGSNYKNPLGYNPFEEEAVPSSENNGTYTHYFDDQEESKEVTVIYSRFFGRLTLNVTTPLSAPVLTPPNNLYQQYYPIYDTENSTFEYIADNAVMYGITPPEGTATDADNNAIMYYTTDGSEPTPDNGSRVSNTNNSPRAYYVKMPPIKAGESQTLKVAAIDDDGNLSKTLEVKCIKAVIPKPEFEIISANYKEEDETFKFVDRIKIRMKRNSEAARSTQKIAWMIFATGEGTEYEKGQFRSGYYFETESKDVEFNSNTTLDNYLRIEADKDFYVHFYTYDFQYNPLLNKAATNFGDEVVIPLRMISTEKYSSISDLTGNGDAAVSQSHNGELVAFETPLTIQGAYSTALTNTDYLYITDSKGDAIKVVSHGNISKAFPESYKASEISDGTTSATLYTIPMYGLVGRYRHNDGFPEIEVRNADADFMPYLDTPNSNPTKDNTTALYTRTTVTQADFNGHRILTGMTKLEGMAVADSDGKMFRLADRLQSGAMDGWTSADNGKRYTIECFIGQIEGELTIFPIKITLDTPRPVASFAGGNIIDEADGDVHIINSAVTLNLSPEYSGVDVTYEMSDNSTNWTACGEKFSFNVPEGGVYTLKVRSRDTDGNVCANPLQLTFRHHIATPLQSIADFKNKYLDSEGYLPGGEVREGYYRMTGEAVVEQVTPYYIYVRDNIENPGSYNHLLIYNDNGWDNAPRVSDSSAAEGWRKLRAGDVITDFALIASATPQGNLRSDATGFARTFTVKPEATSKPVDYDDLRKVQYETPDAEGYFENYSFGKEDRMMHYRFENVLVHRRPNPDYTAEGLIVVDNEDGTVTKYNDPRMRTEDIVDEYVYTLKLGKQTNPNETTGLDIRFNVFTGKRGGWLTSYDPNRQNEVYYTISGVVVRDLKRSASGYSIAMLDYDLAAHAKAPAAIYITGNKDAAADEDGSFTYIHNGKVTIEKAPDADPAAVIYYTLDGTDPKSNRLRKTYTGEITLPAEERTVTVRAFASWPGAAPSDEVSATFRRLSEERTYILNFINDAQEGTPYHFNGTVRVAAVGGDYMFVRGVAGHYLPVHRSSQSGEATPWTKSWEGQYLTDFVIGAERVGGTMRGARITDEYAPFLSSPLGTTRPEGLTHDIEIVPDMVTEITAANARRLVTISAVTLDGVEFEAESAALATEWTLTPNKGHDKDKTVRVNHTVLEYTMPEKGTNGRYYNVTGFVMLDATGVPELWPTAIERVESAKSVKASFDSNAEVSELPVEDEYSLRTYNVEFYPQTMVTLSYEGSHSASATIYYIFTPDEQAPAADAKWNVYGQPFAVISSGYVHAYVSVPGMEESVHTHIELTKADRSSKVSGKVVFRTEAQPDKVIVYIEPAEQPSGEYRIYYTTDESVTLTPETGELYTGKVELTESAWLTAILVENDKIAGEVCGTNIWVSPSVTGIDGIDGNEGESAVRVDGSDIIAPEGSEVYDLSGRRVNPTGLAAGVYIVRMPGGKAVKVRV